MNFHPYAEIFPLIDDADFDRLTDDIKQYGLREKIWTYEGQILDGRNRYMACIAAKVQPMFRDYTGDDALGFVLSLNVHRRHLTDSQRAMAAAEVAKLSVGRPSKNTARAAISQAQAAEVMHVSRKSVERAKKVLDKGSDELRQAVRKGEVAVKKAAELVSLPKSEQLSAASAKKEIASRDAIIDPILSDEWRPEIPAEDEMAAIEREVQEAEARVLAADDITAGYHAELKRQAAEIAVLKASRDGYMYGKNQITKMLQAEQRKVARLEKELERIRGSHAA
jgi:hypothetical protein